MLELKKIPQLKDIIHNHPGAKAYLFDMDGTLFNTEKIHVEASWLAMLAVIPESLSSSEASKDVFENTILGLSDDQVLNEFNLNTDKADLFLSERKRHWAILLKNESQIYTNEILSFVQEIKDREHKLGLVTSSSKSQCHDLISNSPFKNHFDVIITRDDVNSPKPEPEPYLKACNQLTVTPTETVIFEDSMVGQIAAQKAGGFVYKVAWY